MSLDFPHLIEYSVELGYGIIYSILAWSTITKYKKTKNKLSLYFFGAFVFLAITGLYGGLSGILNNIGLDFIPIIGNKILEIYEGLALLALIFFIVGLILI